jgi:hypothetical protein
MTEFILDILFKKWLYYSLKRRRKPFSDMYGPCAGYRGNKEILYALYDASVSRWKANITAKNVSHAGHGSPSMTSICPKAAAWWVTRITSCPASLR